MKKDPIQNENNSNENTERIDIAAQNEALAEQTAQPEIETESVSKTAEIPENEVEKLEESSANEEKEVQSEINKEDLTNSKEPSSKKKRKKKEKHPLNRPRMYRMLQSGSLAAIFLVILILVNVIVSILVDRYPSLNVDLTTGHTNTLSADAVKIIEGIKETTTIYIMADEQTAKKDTLLSEYGIKYSQVSSLAEKIAEKNRNIKVNYVDLDRNPTFASEYKSEGITSADVLVKTEKRHRLLSYTDLFDVQQSQTDGSTTAYSMVDSALASAIATVNANDLPVATFDTGHNPMLDTTLYKSLLTSNQFETKDINLLSDEIPENTRLLVLPTPSADYTSAEIQKLEAFLTDSELAADRSLLITFHPSQQTMPNLSNFLQEWGLAVKQAQVLESSQSAYYTDPSSLFANASQDVTLGGKNPYQYLIMPESSAIERTFDTRGDVTTYQLLYSSPTSYLYNLTTKKEEKSNLGSNTLGAMGQKTISSGGKSYKSNVIAMGSSLMFLDGIINSEAFGDRIYLLDLSKYATGTTGTESLISTKSVQTTVSDISMNAAASTVLGLGVFTVLVPLCVAIAGIIVYSRRRRQ